MLQAPYPHDDTHVKMLSDYSFFGVRKTPVNVKLLVNFMNVTNIMLLFTVSSKSMIFET